MFVRKIGSSADTGNFLRDLVACYLKREKNVVVVHCGKTLRAFHTVPFTQTHGAEYLRGLNVVYIDCKNIEKEFLGDQWLTFKTFVEGVREVNRNGEFYEKLMARNVPDKVFFELPQPRKPGFSDLPL